MQTVPTSIPAVVYGPTDAARMLGISVGYVHRLIELGTAVRPCRWDRPAG
jgi:ABC-type amino acid transport system permease subunit